MLEFVKRITSKLLSSTLLLHPRYIIEHHFDGSLKISPAVGMQAVDVIMTLHDDREFIVHKVRDAAAGCIQLRNDMAKDKVFPTPPYKHLVPYSIQPSPQIILSFALKNYRALKNEFHQQLKLQGMQFNETLGDPHPVSANSQHYIVTFELFIVDKSDKMVLKLKSQEHKEDKVKEAAVKEVIEECVLLGIIIDLK